MYLLSLLFPVRVVENEKQQGWEMDMWCSLCKSNTSIVIHFLQSTLRTAEELKKHRERKQQGEVEARSTLSKCFYKNKAGFCEGQSLISILSGWDERSIGLQFSPALTGPYHKNLARTVNNVMMFLNSSNIIAIRWFSLNSFITVIHTLCLTQRVARKTHCWTHEHCCWLFALGRGASGFNWNIAERKWKE